MQKIPTIFERGDGFKVTPKWRPECAWVGRGEGVATEKLDGVCVAVDVPVADGDEPLRAVFWKRRNPSREEKAAGVEPSFVEASRDDPADKHLWRAFDGTEWGRWPAGLHVCEAVGPKIQGNPLGLPEPVLVRHSMAPVLIAPRSFDALRELLASMCSAFAALNGGDPLARMEGLVFHHPDGRFAKIKGKDFG